jgi:hypothetical protein
VFTHHSASDSKLSWIWIDLDPLRIVRAWEEVRTPWYGVASVSDQDHLLTTACQTGHTRPSCDLEIRALTSEWKTLVPSLDYTGSRYSQFIDDDIVFIRDSSATMRLIRRDGQVISTHDMNEEGKMHGWGAAIPSATGQGSLFWAAL